MTSGSRLKMVGSLRLVGGFHDIRVYSGVFQDIYIYIYIYISMCSPGLPGSEVNDAQVSSWRGCFVMSWLHGDFFPRGMMRWTS
jgi:hypothetical protein